MISRLRRSALNEWWWTIDRPLLAALGGLMLFGIVLTLAGSPPVAHRLGYDSFHFVNRQVLFLIPAVLVMLGISFMNARQVRRLALVVFVIFLALTAATLVVGMEVKGAKRWLNFSGIGFQPSEFLKPAFVVMSAWLFAESQRRPDMPANLMAVGLLGLVISLLVLQPDFGQTMLISLVWAALFYIAGLRMVWVVGLAGAGITGTVAAYAFIPHVTKRFEKFFNPEGHDTFQVDMAIESFVRGGWLGQGPGEGTVKRNLPDSHTDFIYAVAAEEFGIVLCLALLALVAFIVLRVLSHAFRDDDPFTRFASSGLVMLFGLQAFINMAVNLHLIPAKGMTFPFISYGGSSLISLAFGMGMMLALTRKRPKAEVEAYLAEPGLQAAR